MAPNLHNNTLLSYLRKVEDHKFIHALILLAFMIAIMSFVQFATPNLPDNDGYYHIRFALQMREEGIKPNFPYLPFTILNPREFYDHHFLFHAALIPFTLGDLRIGAKWAAVVFASLTFLAVWFLFTSQGVRYSGLWTIGLLAVSESFIYRMSVTRAQSLSLLFLVMGLNWLLSQKFKRLGVLAFLYVWLYDAFPLLIFLALLYIIGVWLIERRIEYRPLLWISLGTAFGLILNPYFPYDLIFIFRHLFPKLIGTTDISVGSEWYPYDTNQLIGNAGIALMAFFSGVLALGLKGEKMDVRTAVSLLAAMMFGFMLLQSRRFVEYFPAFGLIFCAFAWQPFFPGRSIRAESQCMQTEPEPLRWNLRFAKARFLKKLPQELMPIILLTMTVAFGMLVNIPKARESIRSAKPYSLFRGASNWLNQNTPAGAGVFQTDWDDFPRLYFYNTHNTYLIGLDPTYMQLYNGPLYELWVRITEGKVENLSTEIPINFKTRYVVSDLKHLDFIEQAMKDPLIHQVYRDGDAVVFEILEE